MVMDPLTVVLLLLNILVWLTLGLLGRRPPSEEQLLGQWEQKLAHWKKTATDDFKGWPR